MFERRTMIGGGVIGPNDTEFMGYPIVNSTEGPLDEIAPSNCTEGCITRCLIKSGSNTVNYAIVAYILRLNSKIFLIDSSYLIIQSSSMVNSRIIFPNVNTNEGKISLGHGRFPNETA